MRYTLPGCWASTAGGMATRSETATTSPASVCAITVCHSSLICLTLRLSGRRSRSAPACCSAAASILSAAASSLDDLIRPQQQRWRYGQPQRLGGFQIDQQLKLRRLLDREIAGIG